MLGRRKGSGLHCTTKGKRPRLNAQRLTFNGEVERQRAKREGRRVKGKRKRSAMPLSGNLKAGFTAGALAGCVTLNAELERRRAKREGKVLGRKRIILDRESADPTVFFLAAFLVLSEAANSACCVLR